MNEAIVGDRVIAITCTEEGCEFQASSIEKIYPDKTFSHIKIYDLKGVGEYFERKEFITKEQALDMLNE